MKRIYKYNWFAAAAQFISIYVFFVAVCVLYCWLDKNIALLKKLLAGITGFLIAYILTVGKELFSRKVIIEDNCLTLYNFRFKRVNRPLIIKTDFSGIVSIHANKHWLLPIMSITINAKLFRHPLKISAFFNNHKTMYYEIISQSQKYNQNVFIDETLIEKYGRSDQL